MEFLSENLEELEAARAKVGAAINGVGDEPPLLAYEESGFDKIRMIGSMREIEGIKALIS
jgi:hypothetical protein